MRKWNKIEVIFELLVFGIIIGVIEDVVAIYFATGEQITWRVIGIVVLVAVPFAFLGEVVFDNINFAEIFRRWFEKDKKTEDNVPRDKETA